jgi:hypothetical protein
LLEHGTDPTSSTSPLAVARADEALEARLDALLGDPVRLGPQLGHIPLLGSVTIAVLALLPLLVAPPMERMALTGHEIVAGCHLRD